MTMFGLLQIHNSSLTNDGTPSALEASADDRGAVVPDRSCVGGHAV